MSESELPEPGGPVRTVEASERDPEEFLDVLRHATSLLADSGIPFVLMGGIAVAALARPRWTHDIDVFVRLDDARRVLDTFADAGYETEASDHYWLYKAWRDGVPVDIIFRSEGDIYFDEEIDARAVEATFKGLSVRVMPPEDLIVTKAAAHAEDRPYHWFDALSLLVTCDIDWAYLVRRARRAVRRVLALLVYAQSRDVAVPPTVIEELYQQLYPEPNDVGDARGHGRRDARGDAGAASASSEAMSEDLRRRLREDPRVGDLDVEVQVDDDVIVLSGEVTTEDRREHLAEAAADIWPDQRIDNRTRVRDSHTPDAAERVR